MTTTEYIDSIWLDAHILPCDDTGQDYPRAALAVHAGQIVWLGSMQDLPQRLLKNAKQRFNLDGRLLTPGFIDCHTHLVYAGNRSHEFALRLAGQSYADIAKAGGGILATVQATRQASFDELYQQSRHRLIQLMQTGATTVEIKSGYGLDLITERKCLQVARQLQDELPVSIRNTFLGAHALPPEYHGDADGYIEFLCETVLPTLCRENLVDAVDAYCEKIAFSPTQIDRLFAKAQTLNLPVKLHTDQLSNLGGAKLAPKYQALSCDHLEFISECDIQAMAAAKSVAVLLPGAFYCLHETKKPPIDLLRKYQIPIAIATDCNPGTSPVTSLSLIANLACHLFGLTAQECLLALTQNAAKALDLHHQIGSLSINKFADFLVWDTPELSDLIYTMGNAPLYLRIKTGIAHDLHQLAI